mgnify:CR=1 FL=1
MNGLGIDVVETQVGDRYVLEAMRERGLNLGGEQSGHLISLDHATTGDGVLSAVRLLSAVRSTGQSLKELSTVMARLPQVPGAKRATDSGSARVHGAKNSALYLILASLLTEDGLVIRPAPLHGGTFSTYEDHRMATAGAVIGLAVLFGCGEPAPGLKSE